MKLPLMVSFCDVLRDGDFKIMARCETPQVAAEIVRAVNSHQDLIDRLRECVDMLGAAHFATPRHSGTVEYPVSTLMAAARDTIEKATKGTTP